MKALLQRVSRARVVVEGAEVGCSGPGLLVLLGVVRGDALAQADKLARRTAAFRVFRDEEGRMNRSLLDVRGEALVVSQFTLAHEDGRAKGRRPSFDRAAEPDLARALYEAFVARLRSEGVPTATGRFGATMEVELVNDGPVTILLEEPRRPPESAEDAS